MDDVFSDFSLSNNQLFTIVSNAVSQDETVAFYDNIANNWNNIATITPVSGTQVLTSIEVNGDNMFLGSNRDDSSLNIHFPLLQFRKNGGIWEYQSSLYSTAAADQYDRFGFSIASRGNLVIIGAPDEATPLATGKAYYLDTTLGTSNFEQKKSTLFPNSTHDLVSIQNNTATEIIKIEVYSVTGNLLLSEMLKNISKVMIQNMYQRMPFSITCLPVKSSEEKRQSEKCFITCTMLHLRQRQ